MNKKSLIFILLLLTCLCLSMSFVSAENNSTNVNSHDSDCSDSIIVEHSSKSFNDLKKEIDDSSGSEFILNDNYTYHDGDVPILINKSIVINGNNFTLNALNKSSIFIIKSNNVVIKNLNFVNAGCGEYNFINLINYSHSYRAVIVDDNNAFNKYYSQNIPIGDNCYGGAIYSEGNSLVIRDCKFENNRASLGGAIYANCEKLFVDNVDFINNQAYCGASIYLNDVNASVFNSRFLNNNVTSWGSAIFQKSGNVKCINYTLFNNSAKDNSSLFLLGYWEFLKVNLTYYNSLFDFNEDLLPVFGVENIYNNTYELMIKFPYCKPSLFVQRNEVVNKSFCLKIDDKVYNLTVNEDRFVILKFNSTLKNVTLVFFNPITNGNYQYSVDLCNDSFYSLQKLIDSHSVINLTKDYQFYDGNLWIEINKPIIINGNGHKINGMGKSRIFNILSDNVVINNVTFINANFSLNPYDISWYDFSPMFIVGRIDYNKVYYNSGNFVDGGDNGFYLSYYGGAINCDADNLKVINSTFINNYAPSGGAIFVSGRNVELINLSFINNTAGLGGAICNYGQTKVLNSYFNLNRAKYSGNLYSGGNIIVQNSIFDNSSWTVSFKGTWQIDDMNSTYYNSFLKFPVIYDFKVILNHLHDDYYNLKITFDTFPHQYTNPSYFINKKFCLNIDGNVYNLQTNDNSQAEINLKLSVGNHSIEIYNPITKLNFLKSFNVTNIVDNETDPVDTVKKISLVIVAKNKVFNKKVKTKLYPVVLKSKNGKVLKNTWVTLKIKGKLFKAKTNGKGKATFKITKLTKKGKYKATIAYKGNNCYNKASKKVKLIIK